MRKFMIVLLLALIVALLVGCAYLDGLFPQARATDTCYFCEFLEEQDIEYYRRYFDLNHSLNGNLRYELAVFVDVTYTEMGMQKTDRQVVMHDIEVNYCPVCGKELR